MAYYIVIPTSVEGRIDEAKLKEVETTPDWRRYGSEATSSVAAAKNCLGRAQWKDISWLAVRDALGDEWDFLEIVRDEKGNVIDFNRTTVCRWAAFIHTIDYDKDCFDRLAKGQLNQEVANANFNAEELIGLAMEDNPFAVRAIKEGTALFSYRKLHETEWTTKLIVGKTTYELLDLPTLKQDDPPSPLAQQFQNLSRADLRLIATALQKAGT